jgi:hypothetical protein
VETSVADGVPEEGEPQVEEEEEEEGSQSEGSQSGGTQEADSSEGDEEWKPSGSPGSPSGSGSEVEEVPPTSKVRFASTARAKPKSSGQPHGRTKAAQAKTPAAAAGLEAHLRPSPAVALTSAGQGKKRPNSAAKAAAEVAGGEPAAEEGGLPGPDTEAAKPAAKKSRTRPSEVALMLPKAGPKALEKASAAYVLVQMPGNFQTEGDMGVIGRWVPGRNIQCCQG